MYSNKEATKRSLFLWIGQGTITNNCIKGQLFSPSQNYDDRFGNFLLLFYNIVSYSYLVLDDRFLLFFELGGGGREEQKWVYSEKSIFMLSLVGSIFISYYFSVVTFASYLNELVLNERYIK